MVCDSGLSANEDFQQKARSSHAISLKGTFGASLELSILSWHKGEENFSLDLVRELGNEERGSEEGSDSQSSPSVQHNRGHVVL